MTRANRSETTLEDDRFVPPPRSPLKPILAAVIAFALAAIYVLFLHEEKPMPDPVPELLKQEGPPAIHLKPSLVVPGPMQNPHPAKDGGTARPDEAIIFRVDIRGNGYVMIALEADDGRLSRVWGGRPDDTPRTGSQLLYDMDTGKVLAVDLKPHRGSTLTFVAALSSVPWDPFPRSGIPQSPRTFPGSNANPSSPRPNLLAWDRFTLTVAEEIPTPQPIEK